VYTDLISDHSDIRINDGVILTTVIATDVITISVIATGVITTSVIAIGVITISVIATCVITTNVIATGVVVSLSVCFPKFNYTIVTRKRFSCSRH
jgi:TRAP-type mannitol/chloroaromatic compound transport system permease large subunit